MPFLSFSPLLGNFLFILLKYHLSIRQNCHPVGFRFPIHSIHASSAEPTRFCEDICLQVWFPTRLSVHSRWSLCLNHFYVLSSGKVLSQCFLNKNTKYLSKMTRVTTFSKYSSLPRCFPFSWNLQVRCIWLETSRGLWGFRTGCKVQYVYTYIHDHYFGDESLCKQAVIYRQGDVPASYQCWWGSIHIFHQAPGLGTVLD